MNNADTNFHSVTCGLYVNIILHDYLRVILNFNRLVDKVKYYVWQKLR